MYEFTRYLKETLREMTSQLPSLEDKLSYAANKLDSVKIRKYLLKYIQVFHPDKH